MKTKMIETLGLLLLAAALAGPERLKAGSTLPTLEVTVLDASGAALPGADVFVRNASAGVDRALRTDAEGRFGIAVKAGRYEVSAARPGFRTGIRVVEVEGTGTNSLEFRLEPAVLEQSVVVSGSREVELAENSVTKVDIVSRAALQDSGYERVSDILSEESGIVTRSGSRGSRSELQIQGVGSRQALILLDGFPVVGARGVKSGILNLDRQSTNRLDRIEIVKGASSALYGSDAIGGVVNMITRQPRQRFDGNLTASAGSIGTADLRGDTSFLANGWAGFLGVERHKRNPYDLTPATIDTTGPGFRRYDYLGKVSKDLSQRAKVSLLANAFDNRDVSRNFGEGGPVGTTTDDSGQNYGATLTASLSRLTQLEARAYMGKYDEGSGITQLGRPGAVPERANLNERLYRLESSLSHLVGSRQLLQGGVEWTQNLYRGFNRLLGDNSGQQIRMTDAWFADRVQLHPRLNLTFGARFNDHSRYGSRLVPRAGLLFRASPNFRLRASWGQGFRAPDLGQLYFRFLSPASFYQVIGNPQLRPETSQTTQVGGDYGTGRIRIGATFFRNDIENLIQADLIGRPSTPGQLTGMLRAFGIDPSFNPGLHRLFFLYRNIDNIYTSGVEGRLSVQVTRDLSLSSAYTYLDARDKATSAFLSERHRHNGNFRLWYATERLGGLRTNFRGTYFSSWPISGRSGTSFTGDAYQIWDWYLAKPVRSGVEMYIAVDNLFDSTDPNLAGAQPTFFRPDPGRTLRVGMRWNLRPAQ